MTDEFRARLRPKPGSLLADGSIVIGVVDGECCALREGDIYLTPQRAAIAVEKFGWRVSASINDDLVVVSKRGNHLPQGLDEDG